MIFVILFTKKVFQFNLLVQKCFLQKSIPLQFVFEKDFYNLYLEKYIFKNLFKKNIPV